MKPKVRSGQVRKFNFSDWLDCEGNTRVLSSASAMACEIHSLQNLQFCSKNIFAEKLVFHLNRACKTVF